MRPYVPQVRFVFESARRIRARPVMTGLLAGPLTEAGASDHRLIVASIASRRKGRMFSHGHAGHRRGDVKGCHLNTNGLGHSWPGASGCAVPNKRAGRTWRVVSPGP